ncbi:hypothetical protein H0G86_002423 [Trichoderma simmonsii]|uniref:CHAT domain-containing protein n=1 Tax=Trichoderma simmonsii TaxID=1491479 RepID=A0A8G0L6M2_9HYPO|nr:hypothetical protein H0G86_002423 [Trichoderma simmonsii]
MAESLVPDYDTPLEDLDNALQLQKNILQSTDERHSEKFRLFDQEGVLYYFKYMHSKLQSDLDQAIASTRNAINILPLPGTGQSIDRTQAFVYGHLSSYLIQRLNFVDDKELQEEALSLGRLALESLDKGSLQWCSLYDNRYRLNGNLDDLREAIEFGYTSIEMLQYSKVSYMQHSGLCASLLGRYQATNDSNSLWEALNISRQGLECSILSRQGPSGKVIALCNHGAVLYELSKRYQQTDPLEPSKAICELDKAIEYGYQALALVGKDDENDVWTLNQMAAWHTAKMEITKDISLGEKATRYLEQALKHEPPGHPKYLSLVDNMIHTWNVRYQILARNNSHSEAIQALDTAIGYGYESLKCTLETDPLIGTRTFNLAKMLTSKGLTKKDNSIFREARDYFESTVRMESAPPLFRMGSAIQAGLFYWKEDLLEGSNVLLQEAISLLPSLQPESISPQDLQLTLSQISGLATFAAAISLEADKSPYEALRSLEQARCVISGLSMSSKTDLSTLREIDPDLANRYNDLRLRLAEVSQQMKVEGAYQEASKNKTKLLKTIAEMEAQIRLSPGLDSFQLPLTEDSIISLASEGPIILVNATVIGCDAIAVTTQGIKHIPLPKMKYKELDDCVALFNKLGNEARRNAIPLKKETPKATTSDKMLWLWDVAVQPILESIELTSSKRVWWITTGLAGRAPFHAAGNHSPGSRENTISRVFSSYISSFKALKFARDRNKAMVPKPNMLLITMPNSPPPHKKLNTSHEEEVAKEVFGTSMEHLSHPSPEMVLQKLPDYSLVHFACHGSSISYNPSLSGLLLVKENNAAMLTISDLENVNLKAGSIVYLSACSTAEQVDGKFADEAIHLANSFQALGFQHVIGTMWGAEDAAAGDVARRVYKKLALRMGLGGDGDGGRLDVSRALHEAVTEHKEEVGGTNITTWAPFVHIGI